MTQGAPTMDYEPLIQSLLEPAPSGKPLILPDFFLDHFVITGDLNEFISSLIRLAEQGGGNLTGTTQLIRRGGNTVNTASALLALDIEPRMIITTDISGAAMLRSLVDPRLDLSNVHVDGSLSSTVSIEADYHDRRVNLMVSDSGSASKFMFSDLSESDIKTVRESDLIALFNLNHNTAGVELAHDLFTLVRKNPKSVTFLDMGDPSSNSDIVEPLARRVLNEGLVDIVGMNENEAGWFAWALSGRDERWRGILNEPEKWMPAAKMISKETGVQVDLHTPYYAATIENDKASALPVFELESKVVCGAGDAWSAGDIYGMLAGLEVMNRLLLANAVAALYVSSPNAKHPSREDIIEFLKNKPPTSVRGNDLLIV
ncbi:MAG: PfkB family carbohydrate kinase [Candidatus Thorarchaeota archaeon]|jgi:sugar/nucleoside kinase (ribokinase family)